MFATSPVPSGVLPDGGYTTDLLIPNTVTSEAGNVDCDIKLFGVTGNRTIGKVRFEVFDTADDEEKEQPWDHKGPWATGTGYQARDVIRYDNGVPGDQANGSYWCKAGHIAGVFVDDLASWEPISKDGPSALNVYDANGTPLPWLSTLLSLGDPADVAGIDVLTAAREHVLIIGVGPGTTLVERETGKYITTSTTGWVYKIQFGAAGNSSSPLLELSPGMVNFKSLPQVKPAPGKGGLFADPNRPNEDGSLPVCWVP